MLKACLDQTKRCVLCFVPHTVGHGKNSAVWFLEYGVIADCDLFTYFLVHCETIPSGHGSCLSMHTANTVINLFVREFSKDY